MLRLLLILLLGLACESTGVVLLKKGMSQIGGAKDMSVAEITRVVKAAVTSGNILLGVFFEALFFASLLVLMAKSDISFLWPLTGLSFVFATFAAIIFLGERVSTVRWAGVALIVVGAALIAYSERSKEKEKVVPHPAGVGVEITPGER